MPKLEYSPTALDDLQNPREYLIDDLGDAVAIKILKKMITDIKKLEEYPLLGVDLGKLIDVPSDYRYLLTEKNYVFYHLELDKIRVVRVLNGQQDYMTQLFGAN